MRKLLVAVCASSAFVGSAWGADMAYKAPPPPAPVSYWTGLYIGLNAGWIGSSGNTITNTGTDTGGIGLGFALSQGFIPGSISVNHSGFIGGGQIGYNWQVGSNWVWGVEADFDGTSAKGSAIAAFPGNALTVPFSTAFNSEIDTLGTVRARLGFLSSPGLLWYATGGLAYGQTKLGSAFLCPACTPPSGTEGSTALQTSTTSVGWTVGAGAEWKFSPAWSVKLEYLYVDLGSQSNTIVYNAPPTPFTSSLTSTFHERDNIVRVGVNYKLY